MQVLSIDVNNVPLSERALDRRFVRLIFGDARVFSFFEFREPLNRCLFLFLLVFAFPLLLFTHLEGYLNMGVPDFSLAAVLDQRTYLVFLFTDIFGLLPLGTLVKENQFLRLSSD